MKKLFLLFTLSFFFIGLFANPVIESQAYISEIYFDENDDWTIELYFYFLNEEYADFRFYTSSGSADITIYSSSPIVLITANDLNTSLAINRGGDFVYLTQFEDMFPLCQTIIFGNYTGSEVAAPLISESLVNVVVEDNGYFNENEYWLVKDIVPSLGYINEPVKESFAGTLVDNSGIAISYIEIDYGAVGDLPKIWTDETGYFETENMYCKNYTIKMGPDLILEDPLTVDIGTSVYRDYIYEGSGQVQINGHCYLINTTEFDGSVVYFRKNCPEWKIDSAITDIDGYFNIALDIGYYSLIYDNVDYLPNYSFEDNAIFSDNTLSYITLIPGSVITVLGNYQQGVWNSVYPYWILGDVIIDVDDTLQIQGGCEIYFRDNFIIDAYGSFFVDGSEVDSVYFYKESGSWTAPKEYSIHFNGPTCDNSKIFYAVFNNSGAGIQFFDASVAIKHSRFYDNNRSVVLFENSEPLFDSVNFDSNVLPFSICHHSSPIISNSIFSNNSVGIACIENSSPIISHNIFSSSIVSVSDYSSAVIINNVFYNANKGIGVHDESNPLIHNNVFYENNNAFYFNNNGIVNDEIRYNILWNNNEDFYLHTGSIIPEGIGEMVTVNNNSDSCDIYNNIFMVPLFADTINMDFHLTEFSPCIDAGNPEFPLDPDSTITDIGVYYYYHVLPYIKEDESILKYFKVYPNPANTNITVSYSLNIEYQNESIAIKILSLKGKEIYSNHFGNNAIINLSLSEMMIPPGTYLFILEMSGKRLGIKKVIVK